MKQSLLAFLAMSVFSLLALSQQRVVMHYFGLIHGRDYELAAMDLVSDLLGDVRGLAFDQADLTVSSPGQRRDTDDLSTTMGLDPGEEDISDANDIDDYNGYYVTNALHTFNGNPYTFDWSISVCYVDEMNPQNGCLSSGQKSLAKEVRILVKETLPVSESGVQEQPGRLPVSVRIQRVFSPGGLAFH